MVLLVCLCHFYINPPQRKKKTKTQTKKSTLTKHSHPHLPLPHPNKKDGYWMGICHQKLWVAICFYGFASDISKNLCVKVTSLFLSFLLAGMHGEQHFTQLCLNCGSQSEKSNTGFFFSTEADLPRDRDKGSGGESIRTQTFQSLSLPRLTCTPCCGVQGTL